LNSTAATYCAVCHDVLHEGIIYIGESGPMHPACAPPLTGREGYIDLKSGQAFGPIVALQNRIKLLESELDIIKSIAIEAQPAVYGSAMNSIASRADKALQEIQ